MQGSSLGRASPKQGIVPAPRPSRDLGRECTVLLTGSYKTACMRLTRQFACGLNMPSHLLRGLLRVGSIGLLAWASLGLTRAAVGVAPVVDFAREVWPASWISHPEAALRA